MKLAIRNALFLSTSLLLIGCLDSTPKFQPGECVVPVDGSTIYKISENNDGQLKGNAFNKVDLSTETSLLPESRIYTKIPCPTQ